MSPDTIIRRLIYRGRVQGVGFRATTASLARGFRVDGSVRNQSDGSVELLVQGTPEDVERFLTAIADCFASHIDLAEDSHVPQHDIPKGFSAIM